MQGAKLVRKPAENVSNNSKIDPLSSGGKSKNATPNVPQTAAAADKNKGLLQSDMEHIEAEYIRNLQQQVYFLELEANYLREQARKATEMHPQMTEEAERMLAKLREMQSEIDGLQLELKRKDANLEGQVMENVTLAQKRLNEDEVHRRERQVVLDELLEIKKENEILERNMADRVKEILFLKEDVQNLTDSNHQLRYQLQTLTGDRDQLFQQIELMKEAITEKKNEIIASESNRLEIEDKYYNSTAPIKEQTLQDFREEIQDLRRKIREGEMHAERERLNSEKLQRDIEHLVKENAILGQQLIELEKQLAREKKIRETVDGRKACRVTEIITLRESQKGLQNESKILQEQLKAEENRVKQLIEEVQGKVDENDALERRNRFLTAQLKEIKARSANIEKSEQRLRREKVINLDQISDLQRKLEERSLRNAELHDKIAKLQSKLREQEHIKELESSLHSQKWEEFSKLAESMRSLSRSMSIGAPSTIREQGNKQDD